MKVLWLSNAVLTEKAVASTGTWLSAMAHQLARSEQVCLGNLSGGNVGGLTSVDIGKIKQWVVPATGPGSDGLPSQAVIEDIVKAVKEFSPDLIHVWGTETYWGLLTGRKLLRQPALLETQGLKFAIAKVYAGGLSLREQIGCIGLKELLKRSTIQHEKRIFEKWGRFEREIISGHRFITVQTPWLEAQVRQFNADGVIFHNEFPLREAFYHSRPWRFSGAPVVFTTAAYPSPFKGLHIALRAVAVLKKRFPAVQLRVAGGLQRAGIRKEGYIAWLNREVRRLGISDNVIWLGPLTAEQIVSELLGCSAIVIPSFIEGYCLGLAEAMMLGVPAVVSFAGGAPCIAKDGDSALFFPLGDDAMCAYQLEQVLKDEKLAHRLSEHARETAISRNNPEKIVARQMEIYHQVLRGNENADAR